MDINTLKLNPERLLGQSLAAKGTITITTSGPGAARLTFDDIKKLLAGPAGFGPCGLAVVGRYKNPMKWFATLTTAAHTILYAGLHNKTVICPQLQVTLLLEHQELEKDRGTLHWIPLTMTPEGVREIAVYVTGDPEAEVHQVDNTNRWAMRFKKKGREIPHFLNLEFPTQTEVLRQQIWISLPGRRTICVICGGDSHWVSQCPRNRKNDPILERRRQVNTGKQPPEEVEIRPTGIEKEPTDGFMEVRKRPKRRRIQITPQMESSSETDLSLPPPLQIDISPTLMDTVREGKPPKTPRCHDQTDQSDTEEDKDRQQSTAPLATHRQLQSAVTPSRTHVSEEDDTEDDTEGTYNTDNTSLVRKREEKQHTRQQSTVPSVTHRQLQPTVTPLKALSESDIEDHTSQVSTTTPKTPQSYREEEDTSTEPSPYKKTHIYGEKETVRHRRKKKASKN